MVTMFEDDESVFAAMRAGRKDTCSKAPTRRRSCASSARWDKARRSSGRRSRRLTQFFAQPRPALLPTLFPELSEREREILALIAQGHNNAEIAARLGLAIKTVRNHISNIFNKLQVVDRAQAIIPREAGMR